MAASLQHVRDLLAGPRSLGGDAEVEAEFDRLLRQADLVIKAFDRKTGPDSNSDNETASEQSENVSPTSITANTTVSTESEKSLQSTSQTIDSQGWSSIPEADLTVSSSRSASDPAISSIPFRQDDGVITLLPRSGDECRNLPQLIASAAALGASYSGVFKFVMPDDVDLKTQVVRVRHVSAYQQAPAPSGGYHIRRHIEGQDMELEWRPTVESSAEDLASALEDTICDTQKLGRMRYCTDESARTPEERHRLGMPVQSPLSALKGNQLEQTKFSVRRLHSPYLGVSNDAGGIFTLRAENGNLHLMNALYWGGPRVWITIIPQHRAKVEQHIRGWRCAQRARHASVFVPRSLLDEWGVSYNVFLQRPRETVVVSGHTLHEGGTLSRSVAEAVNYGPPGWNISGYAECSSGRNTCPGFPIPNEYLEFLAPGELQRHQVLFDEGEALTEGGGAEHQTASSNNPDGDILSDDGRQRNPAAPSLATGSHSRSKRNAPERAAQSGDNVNGELQHSASSKKRKANTALPRHPPKVLQRPSSALRELAEMEESIMAIDRHCKIPTYALSDPPSAKVLQLVSAIWSRLAIQQFCAVVKSRRQAGLLETWLPLTRDSRQRMIGFAMRISAAQDRSAFEKLSTRLDQCRLAQELELARGTRRRNESSMLDAICKPCGWTRDNLEYHRKRGLKWARVCGPYPGLLSFIPLGFNAFGIAAEIYLNLIDAELQIFHRLLQDEYSRALCSAGKAFEDCLRWDADDVSFRWEEEDVALQDASEDTMLHNLQPLPSGYMDLYDPVADWPAPTDWPTDWAWPADPTAVMLEAGRRCDFCHDSSCECFRTVFAQDGKAKPRIKDYGKRGRGLQAVANIPGQTAYRTREIIGRLTGKVVSVETRDRGWTVELTRPDLPQAGPVCHLSCLEYGSNFRLLNHSCRASTIFQIYKISGRYGFAIVALRDIYHGEELTVSYGKDYFKDKGVPCLCESCQVTGAL